MAIQIGFVMYHGLPVLDWCSQPLPVVLRFQSWLNGEIIYGVICYCVGLSSNYLEQR